ncbi:hypothetical protein Tco_1089758, partial [Tanacetum coccineum]
PIRGGRSSGPTLSRLRACLEEPEQAPPLPDYVPGPEHTDDEIINEDHPGAEDASPIAQSPDYVLESDPEADPEEDNDEDPEEDPVDYPANRGDDGDDEEGLSKDDEYDDMNIEADDEEDEHLAPAVSVVVALPATDQAPSVKETESFETDESAATPPPHPAYRVTTKISILAPVPTPVWSDAEIPSRTLPPTLSPSLPVSPPLPVSSPVPMLSPSPAASPIRPLGYQAAMIWLRAEAASTSHLLPKPPPIIVSHTRPARLGIALGLAYKVKESSSAAAIPAGGLRTNYGFVATMDKEIRHDPGRDVGYGITDL